MSKKLTREDFHTIKLKSSSEDYKEIKALEREAAKKYTSLTRLRSEAYLTGLKTIVGSEQLTSVYANVMSKLQGFEVESTLNSKILLTLVQIVIGAFEGTESENELKISQFAEMMNAEISEEFESVLNTFRNYKIVRKEK